jgi:hypothetical protein
MASVADRVDYLLIVLAAAGWYGGTYKFVAGCNDWWLVSSLVLPQEQEGMCSNPLNRGEPGAMGRKCTFCCIGCKKRFAKSQF